MRNLIKKQTISTLDGSEFRKVRRAEEITIQEIADEAGMAISHIWGIEHGRINASDKIANILNDALKACIKEKKKS